MDSVTTWKTKDGRTIPIAEMGDDHLLNAIRMMREKGFIEASVFWSYFGCEGPRGDMAQMAFESELDDILSMNPHPALDALASEAKARGLKEKEITT